MSDIRTQATIYISFAGAERNNDQTFKSKGLNEWIQDNVDILNCNYAKWGGARRGHYLAGINLTPEQATLFRLKFGYDLL